MFDILASMALTDHRRRPTLDPVTAARARPTSDRRDQSLPLTSALAPLVPGAGHLTRGTVVEVSPGREPGAGGATSLALGLVAAASGGGWCAVVGTPDIGVVALSEMGVDLGRVLLVPRPGGHWAQAAAALLEGTDLVVLCPPGPSGPGAARQLAARARRHRAVLVVLSRHGPWPQAPDLQFSVGSGCWEGVGAGYGHLHSRQVEVLVSGRRGASQPRRLLLPLPQ